MTASHPLTVAPAHRSDLAAIMAVESAGFPPGERWSERSWQGELVGEGRTVLIAWAERPLGVVSFSTVGELADLHRLVVVPRFRRQGVGGALVEAGLRQVRSRGARAVILEVAWDNDPAIALYQRLGFEQLHVREHYYGPGRHALILKLYDLDTRHDNGSRGGEQ